MRRQPRGDICDGVNSGHIGRVLQCLRATVYRRLADLKELVFIDEQPAFDSDGHHHEVVTVNLDQIVISLTDEGST